MNKLSNIKLDPLNNSKGMTLVELLMGILIFSIIALAVTTFMSVISRVYVKANDIAETNILLDNISNEIYNDLWETMDSAVSGSSLTIKTKSRTIVYDIGTGDNEGILCKNSKPVLDRKYYKGKTIDIEYLDKDENEISGSVPSVFYIRIKLILNGNVIASRDYAVNPLGLTTY